jgi:hypothetical protein
LIWREKCSISFQTQFSGERAMPSDNFPESKSAKSEESAESSTCSTTNTAEPADLQKDWKFYCGLALLALSFLSPLLALLIPILALPPAASAMAAGFCLVGAPEICALIAIALLGKPTWNYLVTALKSKLKFPALSQKVSKTRYFAGLALNIGSIIPLYVAGYFPDLLPAQNGRLYVLISGELAFVVSFFILGGQFWEKFKALFVYD